VDEAALNRFLKRDPGVVHSCECATLRRLIAMLRELGVTVAKASEPTTCRERFLDDYRRYLRRERGLAEVTSEYFVGFAEQFVSARFGSGDLNFSELCAKDVTDFVQNRAYQFSPGRANVQVMPKLRRSTPSPTPTIGLKKTLGKKTQTGRVQ